MVMTRIILSAVVPAHPISGLPEIGSYSAHVGYSRHAVGTHNHRLWNMGPRFRGDDTEFDWRRSSNPTASLTHGAGRRMVPFDHIAVMGICGLNAADTLRLQISLQRTGRMQRERFSHSRRLVLSCPHAEEPRSSVNAHELEGDARRLEARGRTQSLVLILRDARTRIRLCGTFRRPRSSG